MNILHTTPSDAFSPEKDFYSGLSTPIIADRIRYLAAQSLEKKPIDRVGELFPHMLNEIAQISADDFKRIGVAWYGIYLYSMIIDGRMDAHKSLSASESLASTFMLTKCINDVKDLIPGDAEKQEFINLLNDSFIGQFEDYIAGKNYTSQKADTSYKKNSYLTALAVAFSALSREDNNVVCFTRNVVLALQYLDDVTDYVEDYKQGNHSVLLQKAFGKKLENTDDVNEIELLCILVKSGALRDILEDTVTSIDMAFMALSDKSINFKHYCAKLSLIRGEIHSLIEMINMASLSQNPIVHAPSIKEQLKRIAFSS